METIIFREGRGEAKRRSHLRGSITHSVSVILQGFSEQGQVVVRQREQKTGFSSNWVSPLEDRITESLQSNPLNTGPRFCPAKKI